MASTTTNKCIYSYYDTLFKTWVLWNDNVLYGNFSNSAKNLTEALEGDSSDGRSRAKEFFRIGFLKEQLTKGDSALNLIREGINLQTDLGFLCGIIYKASEKSEKEFEQAIDSLCTLISVIQSVVIGNIELSISTVAIKLLDKYPCHEGVNELEWIRWLLSALFCELGKENNPNISNIESFLKNETNALSLSIIEQDKQKKCTIRGTFTNSDELFALINQISLNGIINQKAALFIVGTNLDGPPKGFFGRSFLTNYVFLKACYNIEIADTVNTPFKLFYDDESDNSYKPNIIEHMNELSNSTPLFKKEFEKIMDNLLKGAKKAVLKLSHDNGSLIQQPIQKLVENKKIYLNALRTKPFLLLAGISGTGKSRLVKELAYMTCPQNDELRKNPAEPGNYCLIEVKPNWHDSAELLGYYSNLSGRYELTKFIRFAYKAIKHPDTPFFVCLDEMNLAPVEQYFAEYLSVLETRKLEGDKIISSALLSRDAFANCLLEKTTQVLPASMPAYEPLQEGTNQKNTKLYSDDDAEIIQYLKQNGLTLPENLFIIGTVNMDDTTHQFSRKVIDRAFTIEMNGGNLSEMFDNKISLDYRNDVVPLDAFKPKYVIANEALDEQSDEIQTTIKKKIPELLESINNILKETPFCVSYRVQNELILYLCNILDDSDKIDEKISEAFLTILLTKILPRIQGDDKLLKTKSESGNDSNVLTDLQEFVKKKFTVVDGDNSELFNSVINKLEKMNSRLENSYFANFFG